MKLILTIIGLQLVSSAAFADARLLCRDPALQDAQMTVVFKRDDAAQKITATLEIPIGKTSAESYTGDCDVTLDENDWALRIRCEVVASSETYIIAMAGRDNEVSVSSQTNKLPPYKIPCEDIE